MTVEEETDTFPGLWICREILLCPDFRGHETILLGIIYNLSQQERGCYVRNETFARWLKVAKSTVSELLKALEEKNYIGIRRGRSPSGQEERQIFMGPELVALCTPKSPIVPGPDTPPSAERTPLRPSEGGLRPAEPENIDKNINISIARERVDLATFRQSVLNAAGDALADPTKSISVHKMLELIYLRDDLPTSPACTDDEILQAVGELAAWHMKNLGPGTLVSWRKVEVRARELRDKRIQGVPVKPIEKPKALDLRGLTPEQWRGMVLLSNTRDGRWKEDEWGPPPGAQGSFVPVDLVSLWKGAAEAAEG